MPWDSAQALHRHQASTRDANADIVRVHTRHEFTLGDDARTKFVPLDLLPRLLCRAHAVADVRYGGEHGDTALLWRDGCVYELSSGCVGKLSLEGRHLLVRVPSCVRAVWQARCAALPRRVATRVPCRVACRSTCVASTRTTCGGA